MLQRLPDGQSVLHVQARLPRACIIFCPAESIPRQDGVRQSCASVNRTVVSLPG